MKPSCFILLQSLLPGTEAPAASPAVEKAAGDLAELKSLSLQDLINRLADSAVNFAINLAIAIVVFYLGRFIIRKIYSFVKAIFLSRGIDASLSTFVLSLINIVLYFILIVTVIGILGIETTSFLALFASAGVAIGMALSGTLQNFAGGVLILLLKPYKIGDYIEVQGYAGTVKEIQVFFTVITTPDNKSILIPNGGLSTGSVNNYSREPLRRISWTVSISYGDDVNLARKAILDMFAADSRVLPVRNEGAPEFSEVHSDGTQSGPEAAAQPEETDEPQTEGEAPAAAPERRSWWRTLFSRNRRNGHVVSLLRERRAQRKVEASKPDYSPSVFVSELAASSVDLQVRAWVKSADYWPVYFYYNEKFYNELPLHGVSFPFPQLDVHLPAPEQK